MARLEVKMAEMIQAKASMVFEKGEDMGKLKATDYKYNKFVYLPRPQKSTKEAKHEVRKVAMERIFKEVCKQEDERSTMGKTAGCKKAGSDGERKRGDKKIKKNKEKKDEEKTNHRDFKNCSNLTPSETRGVESLKKRIQAGEIVVAEFEKSEKFCMLTPTQYAESGLKPTRMTSRYLMKI